MAKTSKCTTPKCKSSKCIKRDTTKIIKQEFRFIEGRTRVSRKILPCVISPTSEWFIQACRIWPVHRGENESILLYSPLLCILPDNCKNKNTYTPKKNTLTKEGRTTTLHNISSPVKHPDASPRHYYLP